MHYARVEPTEDNGDLNATLQDLKTITKPAFVGLPTHRLLRFLFAAGFCWKTMECFAIHAALRGQNLLRGLLVRPHFLCKRINRLDIIRITGNALGIAFVETKAR